MLLALLWLLYFFNYKMKSEQDSFIGFAPIPGCTDFVNSQSCNNNLVYRCCYRGFDMNCTCVKDLDDYSTISTTTIDDQNTTSVPLTTPTSDISTVSPHEHEIVDILIIIADPIRSLQRCKIDIDLEISEVNQASHDMKLCVEQNRSHLNVRCDGCCLLKTCAKRYRKYYPKH